MSINWFRHIRGLIRRWYRKNFHKDWKVVEHGLDFFQEFVYIRICWRSMRSFLLLSGKTQKSQTAIIL